MLRKFSSQILALAPSHISGLFSDARCAFKVSLPGALDHHAQKSPRKLCALCVSALSFLFNLDVSSTLP